MNRNTDIQIGQNGSFSFSEMHHNLQHNSSFIVKGVSATERVMLTFENGCWREREINYTLQKHS